MGVGLNLVGIVGWLSLGQVWILLAYFGLQSTRSGMPYPNGVQALREWGGTIFNWACERVVISLVTCSHHPFGSEPMQRLLVYLMGWSDRVAVELVPQVVKARPRKAQLPSSFGSIAV